MTHAGMEQRPYISVVTPSRNQGRFIRDNIESVLSQNVPCVEHIVVDGASSDETVAILKTYPALKWISESDHGQTDALNKGLAMARGQWIAWVNSDDYLLPGALEKFLAFVHSVPAATFVFSNCLYVDTTGREIERKRASYSRDGFFHWWRRGVGFAQTGTFFRRELWQAHGPFDVSLNYAMDYDFWLKLTDSTEFYFLDDYLVAYRLHEASKTGEGQLPFAREMVQICQRYWDARGGWAKWKYRLLLRLAAYGRQLMFSGIEQWESGRRASAARLLIQGYLRNPISFFDHANLCFLLRRLIGRRAYERLRAPYRSAVGR